MREALQIPQTEESPKFDKILVAAEEFFAEKGYEAAGMKELASRAGVSQSLLHYHYGTKDKLYAAVIGARSSLINKERLERLEQINLQHTDALHAIIEALFVPAFGPKGGGKAYARIFAGLISGNERDQSLVRKCYDPTALKFVAAIEIAMGGIPRNIAAQSISIFTWCHGLSHRQEWSYGAVNGRRMFKSLMISFSSNKS